MKGNRLFFLVLFIGLPFFITAQKKNLLFQNLSMPASVTDTTYREILYELILNKIISLNKFNIINRSPEMWRAIEKELEIQDFIEPSSAIKLGELLGANYLLEGKCSQFKFERKIKSEFSGNVQYTFECNIVVTLRLTNLETGKFEEIIETKSTIQNDAKKNAIQDALQIAAEDAVNKLSKKFLIAGEVIRIATPDLITINKGEVDGVKLLSIFSIMNSNAQNSIAKIRIVSVGQHEANGKIVLGNISQIVPSLTVKEVMDSVSISTVKIETLEKKVLIVNGGTNMDIKRGDVYVLTVPVNKSIGSKVITKDYEKAKIIITDTKEEYSEAKILEGYKNLKEGLLLRQSKQNNSTYQFLRVAFKSGFGITVRAAKSQGLVSVPLENSNYEVDTDYLNDYKDISKVYVYSVGIGKENQVNDVSTSLNVDIYKMGELNTWIGSFKWDVKRLIIPSRFWFVLSPEIGFGGLKQELPDDLVSVISEGNASILKAYSIYLSGGIGFSYEISRFRMSLNTTYSYLNFNNWKYDGSVKFESAKKDAMSKIIPYGKVNLGGIYCGIDLQLRLYK